MLAPNKSFWCPVGVAVYGNVDVDMEAMTETPT